MKLYCLSILLIYHELGLILSVHIIQTIQPEYIFLKSNSP